MPCLRECFVLLLVSEKAKKGLFSSQSYSKSMYVLYSIAKQSLTHAMRKMSTTQIDSSSTSTRKAVPYYY